MNDEIIFEYITDPGLEIQEFLWAKLQQYSLSRLKNPDLEETVSFCFTAKQGDQIIGGMLGGIFFRGLNIQCLWVDENYRKKGLGLQFLEKAEALAKEKHCTLIFLYSFSFQAPFFYIKAGFDIVGTIEDYPAGSNCYFLKKNMPKNASPS
ncbi:MAG TPA: GNAT family N-acetyltransferase [Leptospiraceae bacterium]|nr:GNAT family N-acetyltransferase [Leptospiraceae bacterium]